ncbi:transmembrane protein 116 isoform X2 [Protopterus annectens]|nr:transmembrane protein 116 isoform X2 [Protopterus annectens]XP_043924318.1 transmembrane protein 116 isoform X2 [Protopterus annectens]
MALLSIIGSSSIIVYAILQSIVRSPEVRPLFYLSLTNLLLGICWLIGALLSNNTLNNQNIACYNLRVLGQIFYMSSFFYTANFTWCLYIDLKEKYSQMIYNISPAAFEFVGRVSRAVIVLSSVIPVILMVPVFFFGNTNECYGNMSEPYRCHLINSDIVEGSTLETGTDYVCRAMTFYSTGIFLSTFFLAFTGILVLIIKARIIFKKCVKSTGFLGNQQWAKINVLENRVILYPASFFCCWGPAVIFTIIKLFHPSGVKPLYAVLCVLQAFTAASQGFLNCFVYGWTQQMFRCLKKAAYRDVDTQTPLLRSQKKLYSSTRTASGFTQTVTSPAL